MDIAETLKKFFYSKKLEDISASTIAQQLGISKKTLSNYINGDRYLPINHVNSLCNIFNISADYLFNFIRIENYDNVKKLEFLDKKEIGKRLHEWRKEEKITQEKLANIIGVSKSSICKYENGDSLILTVCLYSICKKYHVSADYLLGRIDNPKHF